MSIIQTIQKIFVQDNEKFLKGLYRELFNREIYSSGFSTYMSFLQNGDSKINIFNYLVKSEEFAQRITQGKIIHILQTIMYKEDYEFISLLYYVVLGKVPLLNQIQEDKEKLNSNISKAEFIKNILLSEEFLYQIIQPFPSAQ
ncbi:DUF4214 domain-containing protein [Robertmurraya beringensis]|uniref:DUF4214 domain-containing protein n=1 Tax=Robertmurraya beringensis TaxID=641660 RepID=A0ABV6KRI7_9BACI